MTCASRFVAFWLLAEVLSADEFDAFRLRIRQRLVETGAPSIAVALARDGKIVWEEGFGWADRERRVAATEHTMYSLASISKPITSTGLMLLVQRGKLDLDKPVNDYLGEAKVRGRAGDAAGATVRRVANHTSGLPLHYQFFYVDEPYRRPSMDETILRYANLVTRPGERYQYSNLGFGILDYLISRISGMRYPDFMRQEVFGPLGMTRAEVAEKPGEFHAVRYAPDGLPIPFYDFDHPGGSAVFASAHDLVRFGMFHLKAHLPDQKAILGDDTIDEMHRPSSTKPGYGIGWAVGDDVISHTGGMGGVATSLRLVPAKKLALVVLCNAGISLPHQIADEILGDSRPAPPPEKTVPFHPSEALRGTWTGAVSTYKSELPLTLEIRESGDVHARLGRRLETLLNNPVFRDGVLTGTMMGDLGTEDANRRRHVVQLSLTLRGEVLNGAATAISVPGNRAGNALTSWAELTRVQ